MAAAHAHTGLQQGVEVTAEVGFQQQVDQRVVERRRLGKEGWDGEGQRGDVLEVAKRRPHGHHCIRTPRNQEANTDGHTQLWGGTDKERFVCVCVNKGLKSHLKGI